jgi:hypothetical protein
MTPDPDPTQPPDECWKDDPLQGLDSQHAQERAADLIAHGMRQKQCPRCGEWTVWVRNG